ncbi:uncharacterized protein LOC132177142 [Corylus avellana]|uniref:uncharacterized protein LOC132177142 n=1 Tax=Corylus avellana TaxID=13451 RepID=UPI00286CA56C|nr:uncharacterized protein LOC132177142 [Corylus avellana]
MEVANQKLMFIGIMSLVFVVATFPTDARKLDEVDDVSLTPPKHLHYGMLPKGVPIPPSGPSKRSSSPSPPPHRLHYGMLPKGVPVPPSGPSERSSSPSPPPHRFGIVFHGLSKGPVPPSVLNVDSFYGNGRGPVPPSAPNAGPGK